MADDVLESGSEPDLARETTENDLGSELEAVETPQKALRKAVAAAKLRVNGATPAEIADLLGYTTASAAQNAIDRALASTSDPEVDFKSLRRLRNAQLEAGLKSLAPRAWHNTVLVPDPKNPDGPNIRVKNDEQIEYAGMALRYLDRLIKLQGLDAPQVMALISPKSAEFEHIVSQLVDASRDSGAGEADIWEEDEDGVFGPPEE